MCLWSSRGMGRWVLGRSKAEMEMYSVSIAILRFRKIIFLI